MANNPKKSKTMIIAGCVVVIVLIVIIAIIAGSWNSIAEWFGI